MSDDFWEEAGEEILGALADAAIAAAVDAVVGGSKKEDSSQTVAVQESVGAVIRCVGGWVRVAGDTVLKEVQPTNISRMYSVQATADHKVEFGRIFLNSDIALFADGDGWVTDVQKVANRDGRYQDNKFRVLTRVGLPTETPYTETDSNMIADLGGMVDLTFRGDGTATIMALTILPTKGFRIQAFPNGRPDISGEQRNASVFDWRQAGQDINDPTTWGTCHNPVVAAVNEELHFGRDWEWSIEPVLSELTEEAAYCDDAMAIPGGAEPRYEVAFWYRDSETRDSVRSRIKASMDGYITTDGLGRLVVRAGRYDAPTLIIPGEFVTSYSWSAGVDPDDQYDRYEVEFTNPAALYNKDQATTLVLSDGDRADTLDFTMTTSRTQAERLAPREPPKRMPAYSGVFGVGDYGIMWFLPDAKGRRCPRYIAFDMPREPTIHLRPVEVVEVEDDMFGDGFTFTVRAADPDIDAPVTYGTPPADPGLT